MLNIYKPNSFLLKDNIYLFLDIFIKDNKIYLIVPLYESFILDIKLYLELYLEDIKLEKNKVIKYIEYEGIIIIEYYVKYKLDINKYKVKVKYDKIEKYYELDVNYMDNINIINSNLCISTLFKDDYFLLETWIDYYYSKNINDFYLYFNNKINKNVLNLLNKIDKNYNINIVLIEWDYNYWNISNKFKHHAQIGMLNHCLYKYAKNFNYWLNIDLDEYLNKIEIYDSDFYLYNNRWAKLEDSISNKFYNYININDTKFYLGIIQKIFKKENLDFHSMMKKYNNSIYLHINRTKWIINTTKFDAVGIHLPKLKFDINYNIYNENLWFAHFSNWTNSNKRNLFFEDYYILDYHYSSSSS
jgi:hypothetical protein